MRCPECGHEFQPESKPPAVSTGNRRADEGSHVLFLRGGHEGTEKTYAFYREPKEGAPVWLPRSQLRSVTKGPVGADGYRECIVEVPDWLAEKHGL